MENGPFIGDLSIQIVIFHSYVKSPEGLVSSKVQRCALLGMSVGWLIDFAYRYGRKMLETHMPLVIYCSAVRLWNLWNCKCYPINIRRHQKTDCMCVLLRASDSVHVKCWDCINNPRSAEGDFAFGESTIWIRGTRGYLMTFLIVSLVNRQRVDEFMQISVWMN